MTTDRTELVRAGENDGESALAERAVWQSKGEEAAQIARIQARAMLALRMPLDIDVARQRILKECDRVQFAETAMYSVPRGGKRIEGLSIEFARMAFQYMRNREITEDLMLDTPEQRVIRLTMTNLENNVTWPETVVVSKTVERKQLRDGQVPLGTRTNSYGDLVYIIPAEDGDFAVKMRAERAKRWRDLVLAGLPRWLKDEAVARIRQVKAKAAEGDKSEAFEDKRRRFVDAFDRLGVTAAQLAEYLGKPLPEITPAELADLKEIGVAISDKETTWAEVMANKRGNGDDTNGNSKMRGKMQQKEQL